MRPIELSVEVRTKTSRLISKFSATPQNVKISFRDCSPSNGNFDASQNFTRGSRFVQDVKVNAATVLIDQFLSLFDRVFDSRFILAFFGFIFLKCLNKTIGKFRGAHRSDSLNLREVCDGQDSGNNWNVNLKLEATVAKSKKVLVAIKKLRNHDIGTGVDFAFEVFQIDFH